MLISGVQKTTFLDFPGKIACIIFTTGCNLRCQFCHNAEFVLPDEIKKFDDFIPDEIFFNFLKSKIGLLEGVVICGGEPTIQKDLYDFCEKIKDMGFSVKLDTNGQNSEILKKLIQDGLVDYIAMDIKGDFDDVTSLVGTNISKETYLESIEIIKKSKLDYEFRTTLIKNYHFISKFEKVASQISGAKKYFLQNYRSGKTLNKDFDGQSFSIEELKEFKNLALKYVEKCEIRI